MDPRLWFLCPDTNDPSGGVRVIYRAVDHLRDAGFDASVLHHQRGFRCTWFDSDTPVAWADDVAAVPGLDLLVVPEIYGPQLGEMAPGVAKVVFNQNAYNTFAGHGLPEDRYAYNHPEVIGAICVSDDNAAYLRYAFPNLWVERITYALDPRFFHARDEKDPVITYMPRKNAEDVVQVLNLLNARGALDGYAAVPLHGLNEEQLAACQRRSLVFLSFGYPEGCPFPPKEAMACGALVVGYHGMGGRDYFTGEHGWPVPHGDVVAFARTVEGLLHEYGEDPTRLDAFRMRTAAEIGGRYTLEAERETVVARFTEALERAARVPALA